MTAYLQRQDRLALVTQATANVTGKRYCSHHQGEVAVTEGDFVMRNKSRRWICFRCQERSQAHRDALLKRAG
ncbi:MULTISPECIES: hypothetical protein [Collimonas]|jgi:hypothetical protein|uniref:Uncharacterized protein n=1 Tax=Collimonas pratensis TaxID=279113 RepID=A0A127Q235_9BURK|nr:MULTISPECIES: hypothetical protein [Collimonas]AMP04109.1 hypothetical protein CPter91_1736 [Collimonas pratensis]AMP14042.1 hypothetical protein CPter291_1774 [Collimonas pratensis]NKI68648.1 hypothetical protein [Collimonas pratensis]HWW99363.1 hypothetical protein [Collimonas sp.]